MSWLWSSGSPMEVQATIKDLLFEDNDIFNTGLGQPSHSLKDSRATLCSLGLYIPLQGKSKYANSLPKYSTSLPNIIVSQRGSQNHGGRDRNSITEEPVPLPLLPQSLGLPKGSRLDATIKIMVEPPQDFFPFCPTSPPLASTSFLFLGRLG